MKMTYFSPLILDAAGAITLTASQEGLLEAAGLLDDWDDFAEASEGMLRDDFVVGDPTTWPPGFDLEDPDTWTLALVE